MILAVLVLLAVVVLWIFSAPIAQWLRSAQSFDAVVFLESIFSPLPFSAAVCWSLH
jgi:hypothetical protein